LSLTMWVICLIYEGLFICAILKDHILDSRLKEEERKRRWSSWTWGRIVFSISRQSLLWRFELGRVFICSVGDQENMFGSKPWCTWWSSLKHYSSYDHKIAPDYYKTLG
jgi:hypothetical protein